MTPAELQLLQLAATEASLEGTLAAWPVLARLFRRLGAPCRRRFSGAVVRQIAQELLVELGVRPRPDGPLIAMSMRVFLRTFPRATWRR